MRPQLSVTSRFGRRASLAVVAGACAALTACSSGVASGGGAAAPGTGSSALNVALAGAVTTLDPQATTSQRDNLAGGNFYVELTRYGSKPGPNGTTQVDPAKVEGYLAKSWTVSPDGRTYTFTLRPGLKFTSGAPVDAAAVKYSFERSLQGPGAAYINSLVNNLVQRIDVVSQYVVAIHLSEAQPSVLSAWTTSGAAIVDPTVVSKHDKTWLASHEAGSGPFELTSYTPNQGLVMTARPGFAQWAGWGAKSKTVDVSFISSDSTLALKARQGADITLGLSSQSLSGLANDSGVSVVSYPTDQMEELLLAWSKPPFNNPKVRQALLSALPYQAIINGPVRNGTAYYGPIPPDMTYFNPGLSQPATTDVAKAKAILRSAGVSLPVKAAITVDEGSPQEQQIAQVIQASVKNAGFDLSVAVVPTAQYTQGTYGNGFQAELRSDGPAAHDPGFLLGYNMVFKRPGGVTNPGHINIPQADALLAQARTSTDPARVQSMYNQITTIWRAQYPIATLFQYKYSVVMATSVKSFDFTFDTSHSMAGWGKS